VIATTNEIPIVMIVAALGSTASSLWDLEPETTMGVLGRSPPRF